MNKIEERRTFPRITSIDALRAFALYGILLTHLRHGFGADVIGSNQNLFDKLLAGGIIALFEGRCALIFNILFGVSFYIILRKPNYESRKFVRRCFFLMLIGLFNQLFYNSDALMWYGICGMLLVSIRHISSKRIVQLIIVLYIVSFILQNLHLGDSLQESFPSLNFNRYGSSVDDYEFFLYYPYGILKYIKGTLNSGIFRTFANFAIGYLIGRVGFIEKWDQLITKKYVLISFLLYIGMAIMLGGVKYKGLSEENFSIVISITNVVFNMSGVVFYTTAFIWIYNNVRFFHPFLKWLESYGKCGLTNYSVQGFIGVTLFFFGGIAFKGYHFTYLLIGTILFFLLQTTLCNIWFLFYRNGPMEYLWRCATEQKWLKFKK